mgnify:CR=1 FL=1
MGYGWEYLVPMSDYQLTNWRIVQDDPTDARPGWDA